MGSSKSGRWGDSTPRPGAGRKIKAPELKALKKQFSLTPEEWERLGQLEEMYDLPKSRVIGMLIMGGEL